MRGHSHESRRRAQLVDTGGTLVDGPASIAKNRAGAKRRGERCYQIIYTADQMISSGDADVVTEVTAQGNDRVITDVSYALANGSEVEVLETFNPTFNSAINLTGNNINNTITGNAGSNIITGGFGVDTMTGRDGGDTFVWNALAETGSTATTADMITDFNRSANDRLDLSAIDADERTANINDNFTSVTQGGDVDTLASIEILQFSDRTLDTTDPVQLFNSGGTLVGTFDTIQAAVNAAGDGSTILVAAGTYVEQVEIDGIDGLTITGVGSVTIVAPEDLHVTSLAIMLGLSALIYSTKLGIAMRATAQNQQVAGLMGINIDTVIALTFVIGAALAAVAGVMVTMYYGVIDFFIGFQAGLKAFTAAVLGGIGSLPGAMLGGLLIGLVEAFYSGYFSIEYKDVAAFGILVLVLVFRPTGLLGRPEVEKV